MGLSYEVSWDDYDDWDDAQFGDDLDRLWIPTAVGDRFSIKAPGGYSDRDIWEVLDIQIDNTMWDVCYTRAGSIPNHSLTRWYGTETYTETGYISSQSLRRYAEKGQLIKRGSKWDDW